MSRHDVSRTEVEGFMKDLCDSLGLDSIIVSANKKIGVTWSGWIGSSNVHDQCYSKFLDRAREFKENPNIGETVRLRKQMEESKGEKR